MSNKISIAQVLASIDQSVVDGKPVTFSLDYYKANGSPGHIKEAQKSVKHVSEHSNTSQASRAFNHNLRQTGNILLYSHDKGGYREIKVALIKRYNGIAVFHG